LPRAARLSPFAALTMPTVFIIGEDWKLRGALRAELLEQGIEALGFASLGDAARHAEASAGPDLVVLDASTANASNPAAAALTRNAALLAVVSRISDTPQLPPRAVLMRRPLRVSEIVLRVRQMLEGQAA
ncbi:MAG: hypothetical protein ACRD5G_13070, partial [Candidatus Acidiferrales bacterium]